MEFFDPSFWKDFVSNLSSTVIGIGLGIPAALWLGRIQERNQEKEKRRRILRLLFSELLENLAFLVGWEKSENKILELILMEAFLKDELWKSLSDSGELAWIKDPELLNEISHAYSMVRHVGQVSAKYELLRQNEVAINGYAFQYFRKAVYEAVEVIRKTLKCISSASK